MVWSYWFVSYLIGTFLTAYFVAKSRGVDLATSGTGNLGARNAGIVLGKKAFFITMLVDAFKGAFVVLAGHYFDFTLASIAIGLIAVTLGHIFPFWRKFKGGKGVATGIGGMLFITPYAAILLLAGFILIFAFTRSVTLSMLGAFTVFGAYYIIHFSAATYAIFGCLIIIIWAMRYNIVESFQKLTAKKKDEVE